MMPAQGVPDRLLARHSDWFDWLVINAPWLARIAAYLSAILIVAPFFYHLASGSTAYLGLFEDDYFYYATIADHLITIGRLTYDGTTLTNGFHPLWFGVIALLRWLAGGFGPTYYYALALVFITSIIITFELTYRFARSLGAIAALAATLSTLYIVSLARLQTTGMECVVAVPLLMWLLVEISRPIAMTPARILKIGFVSSLAILGRLDIGIAVALMAAGYLFLSRPTFSQAVRMVCLFACGNILVLIYIGLNIHYFDIPIPVSAIAKRLQTGFGFNINYARAVAFKTFYGPTIACVLPLGAIAGLQLIRTKSYFNARSHFTGVIALLFAFLFFGLNALEGWILFGWYAYPLQAATIVSMIFVIQRWHSLLIYRRLQILLLAILVTSVPLTALRYYLQRGPWWSIADNSLLAASYDIAQHLQDKNGLFAMGAVAGVVEYVFNKPLLQLEGIVADRRMVEHIRRQDPLESVLRAYHADYLILSLVGTAPQLIDGCYALSEPNPQWAGKRALAMRGEICSEPMERFTTLSAAHSWSAFPNVETFVWDLHQVRWRHAQ